MFLRGLHKLSHLSSSKLLKTVRARLLQLSRDGVEQAAAHPEPWFDLSAYALRPRDDHYTKGRRTTPNIGSPIFCHTRQIWQSHYMYQQIRSFSGNVARFTDARSLSLTTCINKLDLLLEMLQDSLTPGHCLEFPAIPTKLCENLGEKNRFWRHNIYQ